MDSLNLEDERERLARYELLKFECAQSHELFEQQWKLVAALEQLEQAREALREISKISEAYEPMAVEIAQEALNQQGEG